MRIRNARPTDRPAWLGMRTRLWPASAEEHSNEIACYFDGTSGFIDQVIICENDAADPIGFAELRIRNYAEGSRNTAVPFLEGWFVDASYRGQGAGALLVAGAEDWARNLGYSELASNSEIANHSGIAAHLATGFVEVERSVSFLKKLPT